MLCKVGVLKMFCKIHKKTPVPESFFNKVVGWRPKAATLTPALLVSCEVCEILKNTNACERLLLDILEY